MSGRYNLDELASLAGVTPRTIRYYVTEGLMPPPLGRGPGRHYDDPHLTALGTVQYYRGLGADLASIKRLFDGRATTKPGPIADLAPGAVWIRGGKTAPPSARSADLVGTGGAAPVGSGPRVSLWTKVEIAPGVELQVHRDQALPSEAALRHLAEECRALFAIDDREDSAGGLDDHGTD